MGIGWMRAEAGEVLYAYANGWDTSPVAKAGSVEAVKSVGNSTTCPRDLRINADAKLVITMMVEEVSRRLREQRLQGKTVVLFLRDNNLKSWERQAPMKRYTNVCSEIAEEAYALFRKVYGLACIFAWTWSASNRLDSSRQCGTVPTVWRRSTQEADFP